MIWMNFAVCPRFSWPNVEVEIPFENCVVVLSPSTEELACRASLLDPSGFEFDEGATRLSRFLSRLAWSMRGGIEEYFAIGTNNPNHPGLLGLGNFARSGWASVDPWHQLYLPSIPTQKAGLALSLFRQGMSLRDDPMAFLNFFKVLNVAFPNGSAQAAWLNSNLSHIQYGREKIRLQELQSQHADIGNYLYVQGRCAVSHAWADPIADPDDHIDRSRLHKDLPVIQSMAEFCIEHQFGIPTTDTFLSTIRSARSLPPEYLVRSSSSGGRVRYIPT